MLEDVGEGGKCGRVTSGSVCLAGAVRSADSVQVCPFGPTCGGRLLSGLRRTVVSKEGISGFLGGTPRSVSQRYTGKTFSQRTGAPGDVRSPADGRQAAGIHFRR